MWVIVFILIATPCFAEVVYQSKCPNEICQSTIVIRTDAESGTASIKEVIEDKDVEVTSCVEYNDGDCVQSEYFKVTVKDVT
jgi:hypothetical protein